MKKYTLETAKNINLTVRELMKIGLTSNDIGPETIGILSERYELDYPTFNEAVARYKEQLWTQKAGSFFGKIAGMKYRIETKLIEIGDVVKNKL